MTGIPLYVLRLFCQNLARQKTQLGVRTFHSEFRNPISEFPYA